MIRKNTWNPFSSPSYFLFKSFFNNFFFLILNMKQSGIKLIEWNGIFLPSYKDTMPNHLLKSLLELKVKMIVDRLRLVRVKAFPKNRYFSEMLFSGKENIFMCLVAFQKNFWKIFSDVWLYSWKYHKKHIFYLLLTFSHIFSAPKQTHRVRLDWAYCYWKLKTENWKHCST